MSRFKMPPNQDVDHLTRRFGPNKKIIEGRARQEGKVEAAKEEDTFNKDALAPEEEPSIDTIPEQTPAVEAPAAQPEPETGGDRPAEATPTKSPGSGSDTKPLKGRSLARTPEAAAVRSRKQPAFKVTVANLAEIEGYTYAPLAGAFSRYDQLVNLYGGREAMGIAIDSGLEELDRKLAAGEAVEPASDFSTVKKRVRLQRTIDVEAADRALAHVDPLGVLSRYPFGTRLYKIALGLYLAKG